MATTSDPIPPDVAAYMQAATLELLAETGHNPASPEALAEWMRENAAAIVERARARMRKLMELYFENPEARAIIQAGVSRAVYDSIRAEG